MGNVKCQGVQRPSTNNNSFSTHKKPFTRSIYSLSRYPKPTNPFQDQSKSSIINPSSTST